MAEDVPEAAPLPRGEFEAMVAAYDEILSAIQARLDALEAEPAAVVVPEPEPEPEPPPVPVPETARRFRRI